MSLDHKRSDLMKPLARADPLLKPSVFQQTIRFICAAWQAFVSLPHKHTDTLSKISHVHRVDHKHGAGLGPSEKVTQSSAVS